MDKITFLFNARQSSRYTNWTAEQLSRLYEMRMLVANAKITR